MHFDHLFVVSVQADDPHCILVQPQRRAIVAVAEKVHGNRIEERGILRPAPSCSMLADTYSLLVRSYRLRPSPQIPRKTGRSLAWLPKLRASGTNHYRGVPPVFFSRR
jgi:hypothetical protein